MYTLSELKGQAAQSANEIDLDYDQKIDEEALRVAVLSTVELTPMLEQTYIRLINGLDLITGTKPSKLPYEERVAYMEETADALYEGYVIADIYARYTAVKELTT